MTDREMVTALRAGDRLAAGQIYDIYGTRLYAYCHELLGDHKLAGDALRDTFIVAANRVRELRNPEALGPWLYALARNECDRVGISEEIPEDAGAAVRGDRLSRLALDCYAMQAPEVREVLDLAFRHRLIDADLALVLGVPEAEAVDLINNGQAEMENTLLMVLSARTGDPKCAEATDFGRRFEDLDGKAFAAWLQTIGKHVERCAICGGTIKTRHPLRLFEELPHSYLPPGVRSRVLETLRDPAGVAFAARIAERAGKFDEEGFPFGGRGGSGAGNRWLLPAGVGAAVVVIAVLGFFIFGAHSPAASAAPSGSQTSLGATASGTGTSTELNLPTADGTDTSDVTTAPAQVTGSPSANAPGGGNPTPAKTSGTGHTTAPRTTAPHTSAPTTVPTTASSSATPSASASSTPASPAPPG
ncbi:MAG TPA: sigma factor [Actinocrinis sp.]|nr:sigma factor [Actinocrinis sp.]